MMTAEAMRRGDYEGLETGYQAVRWNEPVIYDLSRAGTRNDIVPESEEGIKHRVGDVLSLIPVAARRTNPPDLPRLSEPEVMRHYLRLSQQTLGYDSGVNLGIGTSSMKYSPKVNEQLASLAGLTMVHPLQPEDQMQGILEIMFGLRNWLCELSGMDEFTFQPRSGAHGIYLNACIMKAYHRSRGERQRDEIITTAVSHPANPGCASAAGFKVILLYPDKETGEVGLDAVKAAVSERTAGLMLTAPYDTGIFDSGVAKYIETVHDAGGLVALDQANFNGTITRLRARDIGADMMHCNLHKTFSTPHGSCGPGTGAVGVKAELRRFLPIPVVDHDGTEYRLNYDLPDTVGKVGSFYGVVMNVVKAYAWIMSMGADGLRQVADWSVLNNNYLIKKLLEVRGIGMGWPNRRKLEQTRFSLEQMKQDTGIGTLEVYERVADYGIQTYSFSHLPWVVPEPFAPEPTESTSREDIDRFVEVFRRISEEAYTNPEVIRTAPHRSAIHQVNRDPLHDPGTAVTTWRANLRKPGACRGSAES